MYHYSVGGLGEERGRIKHVYTAFIAGWGTSSYSKRKRAVVWALAVFTLLLKKCDRV